MVFAECGIKDTLNQLVPSGCPCRQRMVSTEHDVITVDVVFLSQMSP